MAKRYGLSRDERLRRRREFDRVFAEGARRRGPLLTVRCLANGLPRRRLGIAVGRGWRTAVTRNRAKRLIREAFRTHKHELPKGVDVVVVPRPRWQEPTVEALAAELVRLAHRAAEEAR
ncbi:MAG: ribonuclease P protein component [bacterium]